MASVSAQFLYDARKYVRTSHTHHDGEILDLIETAKADLKLGGILPAKVENESDALIKRALLLYLKAEFGLDNPDSEKYRNSYETLKKHLQLSDEYTREA